MNEQDLERILSGLKPTAAPPELRERVRAKLFEEPAAVAKPSVLKSTILENLSVAALLIFAIGIWVITTRSQQHQLAVLLGPTFAERRAEETIRSLEQIVDIQELRALQRQLATLIELASRRPGASIQVHSLIPEFMSDDWRT